MAGTVQAVLEILKPSVLENPKCHPMFVHEYHYYSQQLIDYENIILQRTPETVVAPIRAVGMKLCHDVIAFAKQFFRGRTVLANDPVMQHLRRLELEKDLFSIVTSNNDLSKSFFELQK